MEVQSNDLNKDTKIINKDLQVFRCVIRNMLHQIATGVSEERFKELYHGIFSAKRSSKVYDAFIKDMVKGMADIMKDIGDVIIDSKSDEKLELLSKTVEDCPIDKNIKSWRPTGNVSEHLLSHDVAVKLKRNAELRTYVEKKEAELQQLQLDVAAKRLKILTWKENTSRLKAEIESYYESGTDSQCDLNSQMQNLYSDRQE